MRVYICNTHNINAEPQQAKKKRASLGGPLRTPNNTPTFLFNRRAQGQKYQLKILNIRH
jgi:hypothetical protein